MSTADIVEHIPTIAYVGILIPLGGMCLGGVAIWTEHQRKQKALDVLRTYAENGHEPPAAVLEAIAIASDDAGRSPASNNDPRDGWRKFAFFGVMGVGFGLAAAWFSQGGPAGWPITLGLGITSFVMVALSLSSLVMALTAPRQNGG